MPFQNNPYVIPMSIAGLFILFNVIFVIRRIRMMGAVPLLGMLVSVVIWVWTYTLELASAEFRWQYFWLRMEYFGIPFVSMLFLLFALEYSQQNKFLGRKWYYALWVIPVASLILAWTNNAHGLIWSEVGQTDYGSYTMLNLRHGIFFWIMAAYSYVMLFSGSLILVRQAITGWSTFKFQPIVMIGGVVVTWLGNLLYLSGGNPIPELDWTPMSVILSGMIYSIGLLRFGVLDIMPIAGESVLESMDDMVFVLNDQDIIVFINRVFEYYTGVDPKSLIGKQAGQALAPWSELQALAGMNSTIRKEISLRLANHGMVYFDVKISSIRWKAEQTVGRVIRLNDNTERHFAESRRRNQEEGDTGSIDIPMIVVFDVTQEKIIEVNRAFLVQMGMERKNVIGRSLLSLGIWNPYQRAEFRKSLFQESSLQQYKLELANNHREMEKYSISAQLMKMENDRYVVLLMQNESQSMPEPA